MRLISSTFRTALVALLGAALASCSTSDGPFGNMENGNAGSVPAADPATAAAASPEETASVSMALISVPSDALCLEFAVLPAGGTWSAKTQLFDLPAGASSATLTMSALPAGSAAISARTFGVACAQVTAATNPTWVTAGPQSVTLVAGQVVSASIVLRRPGGIAITATFDDGTFTISPTSKDIGGVQVGGAGSAMFILTNPASAAVPLAPPTMSGPDAALFTVGAMCGTSVPANGTCGIVVGFKPTSAGPKSATLNVGGLTAAVTGTGLVGVLSFAPSPVTFPNTLVGSTNTVTLTLTNTAAMSMSWSGYTMSPSDEFGIASGGTCTSTIAPASSCTLIVKFVPTTAGAHSTTLSISAGASVLLQGTADAFTISPTSKDIGGVQVGGAGSAMFILSNPASVAVPLAPPTMSGPDAALFTAGAMCGTSVPANGTCGIVVGFKPTSAGAKSATLNVGGLTAAVTGTGLVGVLSFAPNPVTFPNTAVGSTNTVTLTLTNTSAMSLSWSGYTMSPSNEFAIASGGTCTSTIAPASSCTLIVKFVPTTAGAHSTTLSISAGASVLLQGSTPLTAIYRVNTGSTVAVSPFTGDQYYSGGTQASYSATINVSGVTNAAPAGVYQSERWGNMTYTFPSLTASTTHTVRLHMAELYQNSSGKRLFNVSINGTAVLTNFDTYAAAGAKNKAVVREFTTTSNSSGQIVVQFTNVTDNASISGIEILK